MNRLNLGFAPKFRVFRSPETQVKKNPAPQPKISLASSLCSYGIKSLRIPPFKSSFGLAVKCERWAFKFFFLKGPTGFEVMSRKSRASVNRLNLLV